MTYTNLLNIVPIESRLIVVELGNVVFSDVVQVVVDVWVVPILRVGRIMKNFKF